MTGIFVIRFVTFTHLNKNPISKKKRGGGMTLKVVKTVEIFILTYMKIFYFNVLLFSLLHLHAFYYMCSQEGCGCK
jgi:hypothetical protein